MLKNLVKLEFQIADKIYHFMCDPDSPIEHIKEALFQCQKYIGAVEDNIKAQMANQEPPVDPIAPEGLTEEITHDEPAT